MLFLSCISQTVLGADFALSWPTPNPAFRQGLQIAKFLQKTGPENPVSSGAYGCVRNNGYKFHEGLDLFPMKRDARGRADDIVFAAMDGIVRHASRTSTHSSYGKYIILEHPGVPPALYSLYAHLAEIDPHLKPGVTVRVASRLGMMGNTSSYKIPLGRSHLHFEVGLRLSDHFQAWYAKRSFKTPNRHGNFSGFNLVGLDPLSFYESYKSKSIATPLSFIQSLPVVAKVRVRSSGIPDFVKRYPSLSRQLKPGESPKAWDAYFAAHGFPVRIEPASGEPPKGKSPYRILSYDEAADSASRKCRGIIIHNGKQLAPSDQLTSYLELIFNP
ncbi:MAG: M23 family metallopeptidase [Verrucomicrobia bacterium]|nr:M23 family metallopeptidase [Verrucomicrobiota bacterium]